jgi:hypothetical protein
LCHLLQHLVAGQVAVVVVVDLEVVHVAEHGGVAVAVALYACSQHLDLLSQPPPVAELRQRVLPRLLEELAVEHLQLAVLEGEPPVQPGDAAGGDQAHL